MRLSNLIRERVRVALSSEMGATGMTSSAGQEPNVVVVGSEHNGGGVPKEERKISLE